MTKGIFITATGTDVGKTYVSALLVKKMRDLEYNCGYFKPVLSGLERRDNKLIPGDADFVCKVAGIEADPMDSVVYAFEPAVSPHLASRMANRPIIIGDIINGLSRQKSKYDYLISEGAGGITCPFRMDNDDVLLLSDVISILKQDVIIVAPAGLGGINYALLTVDYAKKCGINVKGIILNEYEKDNFMHVDNKACIEKLTGIKVIATVAKDDKDINIDKDVLLSIFKEI